MLPKYTALLIDDEPLSFGVIENYLLPFDQIRVTGKYTESSVALSQILSQKPDLLFLDIQMPHMNGFELIEAMGSQHNPYIIFTTAFEQYALQAFEVNALGYLLKPFAKDKFIKAVQKFLSFQESSQENAILTGLAKILSSQKESSGYLDKIMIREARKVFFIPVNEIICFEAAGDYVKVFTGSKYYLMNGSLQALEAALPPQQYIRIHRSYIINSSRVKEFIPHLNGEYQVVMQEGLQLKMSRNYKDRVTEFFKGL
jgi:two-component system LytT family response regulator